jgi:prepilin-type N-terminal cleavage/methylation domain-containing protein
MPLLKVQAGFTLAELLIAVLILGEIATFTIPKIIVAQANQTYMARAKEVSGMVSAAFQQAQLAGAVNSSFSSSGLVPYLNYIKMDTSSNLVDAHPTTSSMTCTATGPCLILHNGAIIQMNDASFSGTNTTNTIEVRIDPQGSFSGVADSVQFEIYYGGRLTTRGQALSGSVNSNSPGYGPCACDPSWFGW